MTDDTPKPANEAAKPASATATPPKGTPPTNAPTGKPLGASPATPAVPPSGARPGSAPGAVATGPSPLSSSPASSSAGGTMPPRASPASPLATSPATEEPSRSGRTPLIILAAILAILVIGGGIYILQQGSTASDQLAQLQTKLDSLNQRTAALEARPLPPAPPQPPNLQPIEQRITALENKPVPEAQLDQAGQKQIAVLANRIDSIDARQTLQGTQEQTDAGKATQGLKDAVATLTDKEAADIAALTKQQAADIDKVTAHEAADAGKFTEVVAGINQRLDAVTKAAGGLGALDARKTRLAQLQAAAGALASGRALGTIAGAPPALAQFATKPPPTDAQLRLSFGEAAAAARKAGQPYADNQPIVSRMWDRLQSGLVVREGDRVIVGDAVSGVLEHAKRQLDAGDLPGAVAALDGLAGPAAQAMAPWRAQAQSLIDARAALVTAARG